jgi:hypothetical protein
MPFVPSPNTIELELRYILFDQHIENRIMVDNGAAVTAADLEAVAIAGWNWAESTLFGNLSENLHLNETVATDLSASDGGQFIYAPDTTTVGGASGTMLPNEVALCVTLTTPARGRSARGRMFIPAIPTTFMRDANNVTDAFASSIVTDVQDLINVLTTGTRRPVVVSYRHDNAPRPGGPVKYPITGCKLTDTLVDSQKRRKPGVGS